MTTATVTQLLGTRPAGTSSTSAVAIGSLTANRDVRLGRWVSGGAVTAGTTAGTIQWVIGSLESNGNLNAFTHIHAYVTAGDSDTVRGTLLTDSIGATEWGTTFAGRTEGTKSVGSVAVQVGDRLVVEVGYRASAVTATTYTGTVRYGGTGTTDLANGNTTTGNPAWIELSQDGIWNTLVETVQDGFSSGSAPANPPWSIIAGDVDVTGGVARIDAGSSGSYSGMQLNGYQLKGSSIVFQLPSQIADTGAYGGMRVAPVDSNTFVGTYHSPADADITFEYNNAGTQVGYTTIAYSAPIQWRKLDYTTADLLYYTSTDGGSWTLQRTLTSPPQWLAFSDLLFIWEAGGGVTPDDYLTVDNVNLPSAEVHTTSGTAAVSVAASATRASVRTTSTTAAATATATATDTTTRTVARTASVTAAATAVRATVRPTTGTAPAGATASAAAAAVKTTTGTASTSPTASATRSTARTTTGDAGAAATTSATRAGAHVTTGTASASASASATRSTARPTAGTASTSPTTSAARSTVRPTARTASVTGSASATLSSAHGTAGTAALFAGATTVVEGQEEHTTSGTATVHVTASATRSTSRTVTDTATVATSAAATRSTTRPTAATVAVSVTATAVTVAAETHTTSGTATVSPAASVTGSTVRATARVGLVAVAGSATRTAVHVTTGAGAVAVTASAMIGSGAQSGHRRIVDASHPRETVGAGRQTRIVDRGRPRRRAD